MGRFDKGVKSYTFADATVTVCFPESEVKCKWCKFLRHYDGIDRDKCALTEDIIFSREFVGQNCPLTIINQIESEELEK